jgi:hypothetical protein
VAGFLFRLLFWCFEHGEGLKLRRGHSGRQQRLEVLGEQLDCFAAPSLSCAKVLSDCQLPTYLTNALYVLAGIGQASKELQRSSLM